MSIAADRVERHLAPNGNQAAGGANTLGHERGNAQAPTLLYSSPKKFRIRKLTNTKGLLKEGQRVKALTKLNAIMIDKAGDSKNQEWEMM